MPTETAQEAFAAMLRDEIAPALRLLGFKGSGRVFGLPSKTHWGLVGFQKNYYSDRETVTFTVNLTAGLKADWEIFRAAQPWIGTKPSGNLTYPPGAVAVTRLGAVMPGFMDRWWEVSAGRPTTAVAQDVVDAIARFGLPWLRSGMTDLEPG